MKSCLICLSDGHADAEPTCPFCGEASWSEVSAPAQSAPAPETKTEAPAPATNASVAPPSMSGGNRKGR